MIDGALDYIKDPTASRIHDLKATPWIRGGFTLFGHLYILKRHLPCILTVSDFSINTFDHENIVGTDSRSNNT